MTRKERLKRNVRLYVWYETLRQPLFWGPVLITYLMHVGKMTLVEIYFMESVVLLLGAVIEIPTGALAIDRVELLERPIDQAVNLRLDIGLPVTDGRKQLVKKLLVDVLIVRVFLELRDEFSGRMARNLLLIKRLHHQLAGARAGACCFRFGFFHQSIRRRRLTISITASVASSPLLPAFVPARSIACSIVSVVRIPNPTGMPWARAAAAIPLTHSPAT